jgi:hypothetical protein
MVSTEMVRAAAASCTLMAAIALRAPVVLAQSDDARPRQALEACAAGDVQKGVALLAELYASTHDVGYVFNQGRCYQQNGQLEQARHRFAEYLRVGKSEPPEDRRRAEAFIAEIEAELARHPPAPEPAPAPIVIAAPASEGDDSASRRRTLKVTTIALGSFGVAAMAAGIVLGLKVQSVERSINEEFSDKYIVTDWEPLEHRLSQGSRYETWQWISYGVGIAALAGAATTATLFGLSRSDGRDQARLIVVPALASGSMGGIAQLRF